MAAGIAAVQLLQLTSRFSDELEPLKKLLLRFEKSAGSSQSSKNSISLEHRPQIAPEAYAITVWEPFGETMLSRYERTRCITIHPVYRNVLRQIGGLWAFELALFGIPKSMLRNPPVLDRSKVQPLDLSFALHDWAREWQVPEGLFYFGGAPHTLSENLGFFLDEKGGVSALLKSGRKLRAWPDFRSFLVDELARAEADSEI